MAEMVSDSDTPEEDEEYGSGDSAEYESGSGSYTDEGSESRPLNESEWEYSTGSEHSDSYVYPWSTSSDDSWASISSDDVIQKILLKLPTYDPPDSDDSDLKSASPSPSQFSDHG